DNIFETELELWTDDHDLWPPALTRELFDAWFSAEATDCVVDLLPEEALTPADVEAAELNDALTSCAWCGLEIDEGAGRLAGFKVADPARLEPRRGLTWPIIVDDEEVLTGVVPPADSEEAGEYDLIFRVCGSRCEKALRSVVSRALRREAR